MSLVVTPLSLLAGVTVLALLASERADATARGRFV